MFWYRSTLSARTGSSPYTQFSYISHVLYILKELERNMPFSFLSGWKFCQCLSSVRQKDHKPDWAFCKDLSKHAVRNNTISSPRKRLSCSNIGVSYLCKSHKRKVTSLSHSLLMPDERATYPIDGKMKCFLKRRFH